eukprot:scaffold731_cov261-Pinguiococcus_pyrenoidosus.AAC.66
MTPRIACSSAATRAESGAQAHRVDQQRREVAAHPQSPFAQAPSVTSGSGEHAGDIRYWRRREKDSAMGLKQSLVSFVALIKMAETLSTARLKGDREDQENAHDRLVLPPTIEATVSIGGQEERRRRRFYADVIPFRTVRQRCHLALRPNSCCSTGGHQLPPSAPELLASARASASA